MQASMVVRRTGVTAVPTKDSVMFMHVDAGQYMMLSGTGRDIWNLIDDKRTIGQIIDAIVQQYRIERDDCETDVTDFLRQLQDADVVEIR